LGGCCRDISNYLGGYGYIGADVMIFYIGFHNGDKQKDRKPTRSEEITFTVDYEIKKSLKLLRALKAFFRYITILNDEE
jgi:hypothetical protein